MEGIAGHRLLSARSAVALGALALVLNIAALVLCALAGQSVSQLIETMTLLPTVAVGTLVAARRPGNPLGWLLLGAGLFFSVNSGAVAYSILDYRLHHGTLPLGRVALALQPAWAAGLVMVAGCLWLFPDGHLPSGRWRRVGGILFGAGESSGSSTGVSTARTTTPRPAWRPSPAASASRSTCRPWSESSPPRSSRPSSPLTSPSGSPSPRPDPYDA